MTDWTSGYVADIGYTHGYYTELNPSVLSLVATARNVRSPDPTAPLAYCELGCGQGFSANLLAAANPQVQYYATDFNPAHVAGAKALARDAGLTNVHFYDDSFAEFLARDDLPQFDFVSLHGIYSWVAAEHRETIAAFILRKLKPGGLVYVSYNAHPGWAAAAPMRQLMYLHGKAQGGPTIGRVKPAIDFLGKLVEANAKYFLANTHVKSRWEQLEKQNHNYLAHEYMNDVWTVFYHAEVAAELSAAKLSFVGSAALLEQVDSINFAPEQKQLMDETTDPVLRETLRDYLTNQQFRRDVFAKGPTVLPASEGRELWGNKRFALTVPRDKVSMKVKGALGEANLHASVYEPILDALAKGPATVQEVMANDAIAALGWPRIIEAFVILAGSAQIVPCLPAAGEAARAQRTKAFNAAVIARARDSGELNYLASPVTGGGVSVNRFNQLFLLAMQQGHQTVESQAEFVWEILKTQGQLLIKDGNTLQGAEENLAELKGQAKAFAEGQLLVLKALLVA